jgi:hypothetical protein
MRGEKKFMVILGSEYHHKNSYAHLSKKLYSEKIRKEGKKYEQSKNSLLPLILPFSCITACTAVPCQLFSVDISVTKPP